MLGLRHELSHNATSAYGLGTVRGELLAQLWPRTCPGYVFYPSTRLGTPTRRRTRVRAKGCGPRDVGPPTDKEGVWCRVPPPHPEPVYELVLSRVFKLFWFNGQDAIFEEPA